MKTFEADVVIIGSGAGGGTAFNYYAAKKSTILVEEGFFNAEDAKKMSVSESTRKMYRNSGLRVAVGRPTITIGEGCAVGGSTEINGGLMWRTPIHKLKQWASLGIKHLSESELTPYFERVEKDFNVISEFSRFELDVDSEKLIAGSKNLNWKIVPARRAVSNCEKRNLCPSGCPSGAKQTISRVKLNQGVLSGGEILKGVKVMRIRSRKKSILLECKEIITGETVKINASKCIVSCGAIETPRLLARSNFLNRPYGTIGMHINLKILAEFPEEINPDKSTIFTHQVQEFMEDGILFMAANLRREYLAFASSHLSNVTFEEIINKFKNYAMYTSQIEATTRLFDIGPRFGNPVLVVKYSRKDKLKIKESLVLLSRVLFAAGAKKIILPYSGNNTAKNMIEISDIIGSNRFQNLNLTTVHLMSSLPLKKKSKIIDDIGRLKKDKRIQILDASILPTTIGESPEETIVTIAEKLLELGNK